MIIKTRLKNARHMIKNNSEIKLDYIARSCGFNDTSYFCKAYKKSARFFGRIIFNYSTSMAGCSTASATGFKLLYTFV